MLTYQCLRSLPSLLPLFLPSLESRWLSLAFDAYKTEPYNSTRTYCCVRCKQVIIPDLWFYRSKQTVLSYSSVAFGAWEIFLASKCTHSYYKHTKAIPEEVMGNTTSSVLEKLISMPLCARVTLKQSFCESRTHCLSNDFIPTSVEEKIGDTILYRLNNTFQRPSNSGGFWWSALQGVGDREVNSECHVVYWRVR